MGPDFFFPVGRAFDRRRGRSRDQSFNWARPTFGESRTRLERSAVELEISRVSIRTRCRFDGFLRRAWVCQLANRPSLFRDYRAYRHFAPLRGRALFVRRCLRCAPWNFELHFGHVFLLAPTTDHWSLITLPCARILEIVSRKVEIRFDPKRLLARFHRFVVTSESVVGCANIIERFGVIRFQRERALCGRD